MFYIVLVKDRRIVGKEIDTDADSDADTDTFYSQIADVLLESF
jgi:hypothetical protein